MKFIAKQFKQILLTTVFLLCVVPVISQVRPQSEKSKAITRKRISSQLKEFYNLTTQANAVFVFPAGFREIPVTNNEDFPYDYAIELPGHEFEIWFQVKSLKENYADYVRLKNDPTKRIRNPDSLYNDIGQAQAITFNGDKNYLTRIIPPDVLKRYNADAGKTYLLNLQDLAETKHYKYALLITLQKDHIGTIIAVCFSNVKGPEFFKNINKVSKCLKFKP